MYLCNLIAFIIYTLNKIPRNYYLDRRAFLPIQYLCSRYYFSDSERFH
jgi:hypothetical protein